MGNNHSSTSKTATPSSSTPPQTSSSSSSHKAQSRSILPVHTSHRSAAPPERSLAEAQGSTVSATKPKSVPNTAASSLSPSPHNSVQSPVAAEAKPIHHEPSKPVDVPFEASSLRGPKHSGYDYPGEAQFSDPHLMSSSSITDAYISRPPRLPLPIEEEVHTPGSPILGPDEAEDLPDVEPGDSSDGLTRKSSMVSATTEDEDGQELRVDKTRPVVPTKIEWKRGGEKVYVTGTIFQWNRKQRLHPVEGKPGCFAGTIYILPGTHHVRFVVDGIMQTSPDLPTTVDFGNNLVNYIEVSAEEALQQAQTTPSAQPTPAQPATDAKEEQLPKLPRGKAVLPSESYHKDIPQYLLDFDQAEDSPAYQNAVAAIEKLPTPPSLPGFLGKPILNAATLMKDDNSVLNMPNHTVLNHLATSSIKNNVLAVCATTRYHNKYVTTIIYKPTSADEG